MHITLIVHYYPPINSSGAKRAETLSKYLVRMGHRVTVITTQKRLSDGEFTEQIPEGVELIELDAVGRVRASRADEGKFEPMYTGAPSWKRRVKDRVMDWLGQVPDPRLPFALSFLAPRLAPEVQQALSTSDVVMGSTPPWPMLLAALIVKRRFGVPCILDYRDHFSECHEMPGGRFAKWLEAVIDRRLVKAADRVVTISEPMSSYYRTIGESVTTIMNGYDHEVIEAARARAESHSPDRVIIRYMGLVSPGRVPHRLLVALSALRKRAPEKFSRIRIEFYGNAALIEQALQGPYSDIAEAFAFMPAVPYLTSMQRVVEADYLLFSETSSKATLSAQGILTTKLFEYIGSGRPVLADISTDTLAGSLLKSCSDRHVVGDDAQIFLDAMLKEDFYVRAPTESSVATLDLSRKAQADRYVVLMGEIAAQKHAHARQRLART